MYRASRPWQGNRKFRERREWPASLLQLFADEAHRRDAPTALSQPEAPAQRELSERTDTSLPTLIDALHRLRHPKRGVIAVHVPTRQSRAHAGDHSARLVVAGPLAGHAVLQINSFEGGNVPLDETDNALRLLDARTFRQEYMGL
jgi:hypothetical protein